MESADAPLGADPVDRQTHWELIVTQPDGTRYG